MDVKYSNSRIVSSQTSKLVKKFVSSGDKEISLV